MTGQTKLSGPAHYTAAERLLAESRTIGADDLTPAQLLAAVLAEAQAHATLALAAATALAENGAMPNADYEEWESVAGNGGQPPRNTGLVWWLDDGGESPEPELYASYSDAASAGKKRWRDANPTTTAREEAWLEAEDDGSPDDVQLRDLELHMNGWQTGIFVRARRPKGAAPAEVTTQADSDRRCHCYPRCAAEG